MKPSRLIWRLNWSIASSCARNSSWNADYLHRGFITDRKITIPYCMATIIVSTISCMWTTMPGMYRPRQSLRHTSGNKDATIQQLTLRQNEIKPREQIALTKSIKWPREIFITFETEKISAFEKPQCVTSLTIDARISKPLTCSRNFLVTKARVNGAEAVDMLSISECFSLPKPANDLNPNTCYQFLFEESRSFQRTSLFLIAS